VKADPKLGQAYEALGDAYLRAGDPANALESSVRAADLLPQQPSTQLQAGSLLLLAGRHDDARARAEKVLEQDPKNVLALILRANALAGLADFGGALRQAEEAVRLDPNRPWSYANLGEYQLAQGKREEAEATFARAIQLAPDSADARLAIAQFYLRAGDVTTAERYLLEAVRLAPNDLRARRALTLLYLQARRPGDAEPHMMVLAERGDDGTRMVLADFYTALGQLDQAAALLDPLGAKPDVGRIARARLSLIRYAQGRQAEAHAMADALLSEQPKDENALLAKTRMKLGDGALSEALASIQAATSNPEASADAFYWQGMVQSGLGQYEEAVTSYTEALRRNPTSAPTQMELARLQLALGDIARAREYATAALAGQPRALEPRLLLVQALVAAQDLGAAERELAPLLALKPPPAIALVQLGRIKWQQKDTAGARKALSEATRLDPASFDAVGDLVTIDLSAAGARPAARQRLQAYLAANPKNAQAMVRLAGIQLASGERQAGEARLRKVIETDPSSIAAYSMLGNLYLSEGKADQALREFQAIVKQRPANLGAQTMVGIALEALGRTEEARKHYEALVTARPNAAVAGNNLAWIYAQSGERLDMALQLVQDAKRVLPDSPEVDDTLGYVYLKKNLPPLALRPLRTAVEKLPNNPVVRWHLAQALAATGDKAGAIAEIEAALELSATFDGAAQARAKLLELRSS
jgi:tetratricopeptide (TPR) repeat protein